MGQVNLPDISTLVGLLQICTVESSMGLNISHLHGKRIRSYLFTDLVSRWTIKWPKTSASKSRRVFQSRSWIHFVAITWLFASSKVSAHVNEITSINLDSTATSDQRLHGNQANEANVLNSHAQFGHLHSSPEHPHIVVRSIGDISQSTLQTSCRWIEHDLGLSCSVISDLRIDETALWPHRVKQAWNPDRQQLDGKKLIDQLFHDRSQRLTQGHDLTPIELWISADDIYEGDRPFVFGLTSLTDRVAIVSTARLSIASPLGPSRLRKLVLHELGHAFGLHHHDIPDCAMRVDGAIESLDLAPQDICAICLKFIAIQIYSYRRSTAIIAFNIALGQLARGNYTHADNIAKKFILNTQPLLALQLAMAFARAQENSYAIAWFEFTLMSPEIQHLNQAPIHLALARSFEQRKKDRQDIQQAKYHFERTIELNPKWKLAHDELQRFLNSLQKEKLAVVPGTIQLCILPSTSC